MCSYSIARWTSTVQSPAFVDSDEPVLCTAIGKAGNCPRHIWKPHLSRALPVVPRAGAATGCTVQPQPDDPQFSGGNPSSSSVAELIFSDLVELDGIRMEDFLQYKHRRFDLRRRQIRLVHIVDESQATSDLHKCPPYRRDDACADSLSSQTLSDIWDIHRGDISQIRIQLEIYDIDNAPPYTAISYAWGSKIQTSHVRIGSHYLPIGKNLDLFLQHHRQIGHLNRHLWIDQICIYQNSVTERNHQVTLMAEIFSHADCVLAWVGAHASSSIAVEAINVIHEILVKCNDLLGLSSMSREQINKALAPCHIESLRILSCMPYWSRLWVAQELALVSHREVMYGHHILPWSMISSLTAVLSSPGLRYAADSGILMLEQFVQACIYYEKSDNDDDQWHLLYIALTLGICSSCRNPRDKVFGLQSVLDKSLQIDVDYGMSTAQVFQQAALLYAGKLLDVGGERHRQSGGHHLA